MPSRGVVAAVAAVVLGGSGLLALAASNAWAEPVPPGLPQTEGMAAALKVNPVLENIIRRLGQTSVAAADREDLAALSAYYNGAGAPLFVTALGYTLRAESVMAEIRSAADWGLDAKAFALPAALPDGEKPFATLADAEIKLGLAALKYARYASGGRVDPAKLSKYLDMKPTLPEPKVVLAALAATDDAGSVLQGYHPKHEQFLLLKKALLAARSPAKPATEPAAAAADPSKLPLDGPALKPGANHPDILALRKRLGVPGEAGREDHYDSKLLDAVKAFQKQAKLGNDGVISPKLRAALNGKAEVVEKADPGKDVERIILSMERWRWMPRELGAMYVWDNIPEFQTRVVKGETVIHQEKIIVGKTNTPTPSFSAKMQFVIFHPDWGVPDSIKIKEILPYLRRPAQDSFFGFGGGADTRVLQRHNLKVTMNGRPVDASQVDWNAVDVRQFQFTQPPGGTNVLGVVKFRFPNRHDVYMHDTPQRELFQTKVRTYSHGCVRVHNPQRLAEVILAEEGMTPSQVEGLIKGGAKTEVTLKNQIPVHVTYMTAVASADGKVETFSDIYGHDNRLQLALSGKQTEFTDPVEIAETPAIARQARIKAKASKQEGPVGFLSGLFGN